ncbi:MAG: hypothetical protein LAN59_02225 [Acidobacteriia bacterium]|nr:hypothetical protein [Terriglobia bacterium]
MTGKRYYLTTFGAWQQHAARFANSHFIVLDAPDDSVGARHAVPAADGSAGPDAAAEESAASSAATSGSAGLKAAATTSADGDRRQILVLIDADEGVHLALEDDSAFEALPHPLAQKPISDAAHAALAPHGVAPGATTFDAAEALARLHPLLRHRVF